jgi:hypothetical protein
LQQEIKTERIMTTTKQTTRESKSFSIIGLNVDKVISLLTNYVDEITSKYPEVKSADITVQCNDGELFLGYVRYMTDAEIREKTMNEAKMRAEIAAEIDEFYKNEAELN